MVEIVKKMNDRMAMMEKNDSKSETNERQDANDGKNDSKSETNERQDANDG